MNKHLYSDIRSDREVKDSFSVSYWEELTFSEDQPVCRANYNYVYLIKEGAGSIQIDEQEYPIAGAGLFIVAKGQLYTFKQHTFISGYEIVSAIVFGKRPLQVPITAKLYYLIMHPLINRFPLLILI